MYEKAQKPPPPGSPTEILFILVWNMRQHQEFHKSRAVAQALMSQKGAEEKTINEAFEKLREAFFPFDKNAKRSELKDMRHHLLTEIARGPLSVTPLEDPNRRKVASRLVQGQSDLARREAMTKAGALSRLDPFEKARNRKRSTAS